MLSLSVRVMVLGGALAAAAPAFAETTTGYMVLDISTGAVLATSEARTSFIPASVAKLPAALAILDTLGPSTTFATTLTATGPVEDGVLRGTLTLKGGGDPTLDAPRLVELSEHLARLGIHAVEGAFSADASALPSVTEIDDNQPSDAPYNPGIGALSLNFNRYEVAFAAGAAVGLSIPLDPLPVSSDVLRPLPGTEGTRWLPVRRPASFAARAFKWTAKQYGIDLPEPTVAAIPSSLEQTRELVRLESPPVAEILRQALLYSNNMILETLALSASRASSLEAAARSLQTTAEAAVSANVSWTGMSLRNASGLSDASRMTPEQCAAFALTFATASVRDVPLRPLLPPLHLEPFATPDPSDPADPPLRAKSGTIHYARALAGVTRTSSGREVAFCVMTNDLKRRAAFDALPIEKRQSPDILSPAREWLKAARDAEKGLILGWMSTL